MPTYCNPRDDMLRAAHTLAKLPLEHFKKGIQLARDLKLVELAPSDGSGMTDREAREAIGDGEHLAMIDLLREHEYVDGGKCPECRGLGPLAVLKLKNFGLKPTDTETTGHVVGCTWGMIVEKYIGVRTGTTSCIPLDIAGKAREE